MVARRSRETPCTRTKPCWTDVVKAHAPAIFQHAGATAELRHATRRPIARAWLIKPGSFSGWASWRPKCSDLEGGLDNGVAGKARGDRLEISSFPGRSGGGH